MSQLIPSDFLRFRALSREQYCYQTDVICDATSALKHMGSGVLAFRDINAYFVLFTVACSEQVRLTEID